MGAKGERLPTIVTGMDINDLAQVIMPHSLAAFDAMKRGEAGEMDRDAINADLARLPHEPDEMIE